MPLIPWVSRECDTTRQMVMTRACDCCPQVYEGAMRSTRLLSASGDTIPSDVEAIGTGQPHAMVVEFSSSTWNQRTGFEATFSVASSAPATTTGQGAACSGTTVMSTSSGTFTDGSAADSDYLPSLYCRWVILSEGGTITLQFNRFNTQSDYDYVKV